MMIEKLQSCFSVEPFRLCTGRENPAPDSTAPGHHSGGYSWASA